MSCSCAERRGLPTLSHFHFAILDAVARGLARTSKAVRDDLSARGVPVSEREFRLTASILMRQGLLASRAADDPGTRTIPRSAYSVTAAGWAACRASREFYARAARRPARKGG